MEDSKKTARRKFSAPKGYGGFVPTTGESGEGDWTLDEGDWSPEAPPAAASESGPTETAPALAEHGADPRPDEPVGEASGKGNRVDEVPFSRGGNAGLGAGGVKGPVLGIGDTVIRTHEVPPPPPPRHTALWTVVVLLVLALAGETWYGWNVLREHNIQLSQLPGFEQTVSTLGGRLGAAESQLNGLSAQWSHLTDQVSGLNHHVDLSLAAVEHNTHEQIAQAESHVQGQLDERTRQLDARLERVESGEKAHGQQLASLEQQQSRTRQDVQRQIASARQEANERFANLGRQVNQNQGDVETLARQVARQRVDFELARNDTRQIVPGISLRVTKTNVSYQRYDGYLWLMADGRALWLSNVGVQQPVVFYPRQGGEAYQLVMTRIASGSVVGYLLQPVTRTQGANGGSGGGT